MGFSRQEYWSGVQCPPPGDLPNPGIKPASLMFPALAGEFFMTRATWEALNCIICFQQEKPVLSAPDSCPSSEKSLEPLLPPLPYATASAQGATRVREGNGTLLRYSCLESPMDGGAWGAAVHGVAKSWTQRSYFPFIFHFHALEKEMATHSSVLAWRVPGTGEPGGLPSMPCPPLKRLSSSSSSRVRASGCLGEGQIKVKAAGRGQAHQPPGDQMKCLSEPWATGSLTPHFQMTGQQGCLRPLPYTFKKKTTEINRVGNSPGSNRLSFQTRAGAFALF